MTEIVAATNNEGKLRELRELCAGLGARCLSLREAGIESDPEETGASFEENALIKARAAQQKCRLPVLADDSGVCIDALGGAPGVYTARYAGEHATNEENIDKLLCELSEIKDPLERGGRYVCAAVLLLPDGRVYTARGECEGFVGFERRGEGGFGYDPIFCLPDGRSMAQIPPDEKDLISHRGRALRLLFSQLDGVL